MSTFTLMAGIERQPGTGGEGSAHVQLFRVYVVHYLDFGDKSKRVYVMENESYGVASGVCDAVNARLGHGGALAAKGRTEGEEVQEVARRIVENLKDRMEREGAS